MQVNSYDYTGTKLGLKLVLIPDVSLVSIEVDSQNISNGSGFIRNNAKTVAGDIDKLEATAFTLNWTYRL